ncbi:MAG: AAA family ATPase [Halothiobacillaceae bacterium]
MPHPSIRELRTHLETYIVGQSELIDRLLISLLTGGHLLVEGLPGLAKTTAIKTLADGVHARFKRIQFTPDLLPSDLIGAEIYHPETHQFTFEEGPIFNEIVLADEINRAPAKVQSALLEAMQEKQVTVSGHSHRLPEVFMVMATQNPLDQSGTYPLPEAQLDRFLMHVALDYPDLDQELEVLRRARARNRGEVPPQTPAALDIDAVLTARQAVTQIHIAPELERWIIELVAATRNPGAHLPELEGMVLVGASPRGALALSQAASAAAWLAERDYVSPDDLIRLAPDALRHRIILSPAAFMAKVDRDDIIGKLLEAIPTP